MLKNRRLRYVVAVVAAIMQTVRFAGMRFWSGSCDLFVKNLYVLTHILVKVESQLLQLNRMYMQTQCSMRFTQTHSKYDVTCDNFVMVSCNLIPATIVENGHRQ